MTMKINDLKTPHTHMGPFAVLPDYQSNGVGSKLFENYLSRLEGISYFETFAPYTSSFYQNREHKLIKTSEALGIKGYWLRRD